MYTIYQNPPEGYSENYDATVSTSRYEKKGTSESETTKEIGGTINR